MINKLFYSQNNKNAIKSIICENINIKINNQHDMMINDTMEYVLSQVSPTPPKGIPQEEYIFLMNKKVYDIVSPIIKKSIVQRKVIINEQQPNQSNQSNQSNQNRRFDSINDSNRPSQSLIKNLNYLSMLFCCLINFWIKK